MNKLFLTLTTMAVFMMGVFPVVLKAEPAYVTDCLEGNLSSEDCLEESDKQSILDEQEKNESDILVEDIGSGSLIISMIKTGIILILILFFIYFLLRTVKKRNKLYNQTKTLQNIGGISVGANKSIQIVRVGSKVYMIGVGENVALLEEIDDKTVIKELEEDQSPSNAKANYFKTLFSNPDRQSNNEHSNFKNMFSDELEKLKENRLKITKQHRKKDD